MTDYPILIIGTGIGELTAALELQRVSYRVALYVVATDLAEAGAGLTITPNATHALGSLGPGERLAELADIPDGSTVRHYRTGEAVVKRQRGNSSLEPIGANYYQMHRADLDNILAEEVLENDPDCDHLNHYFDALLCA